MLRYHLYAWATRYINRHHCPSDPQCIMADQRSLATKKARTYECRRCQVTRPVVAYDQTHADVLRDHADDD